MSSPLVAGHASVGVTLLSRSQVSPVDADGDWCQASFGRSGHEPRTDGLELTVIARIRKSLDERDGGFTLVELLVVMIIIGILAAIAIPVFLNQQKKARDTSAKADVSTVGKAITSYYVDGTGALTFAAGGDGWILSSGTTQVDTGKLSSGNTVATASNVASNSSFCVAIVTSDTGADHTWKYTQDGLAKGTC